jgi:hypothetical protein
MSLVKLHKSVITFHFYAMDLDIQQNKISHIEFKFVFNNLSDQTDFSEQLERFITTNNIPNHNFIIQEIEMNIKLSPF